MAGYIGSGFENIIGTYEKAPFGHTGPKKESTHGQLTYSAAKPAAETGVQPIAALHAVSESVGSIAVDTVLSRSVPQDLNQKTDAA